MDEHPDDFSTVCADPAVCPNVKWAHNLYKTASEAEYAHRQSYHFMMTYHQSVEADCGRLQQWKQ